jgi:hypothetical protein
LPSVGEIDIGRDDCSARFTKVRRLLAGWYRFTLC